ncbi:MAG TPA: EpsG family protein [Dyella sp.]|nr:EpsG family protein [Dyella sp.]
MTINEGLVSSPAAVPGFGDSAAANARAVVTLLLLAAAWLAATAVVSLRAEDVGTDTHIYAWVFLAMRHGEVATRFEPGFVALTRISSSLGMGVVGYQATLFLVLLTGAAVTARKYLGYLGSHREFLTFLSAVTVLLFVSPMFVNASINAVRQGLAAPLVFAALLAFHRRQWRSFLLLGALASSLHYSSLIYLGFAPVLLLKLRTQRILAAVAFLAYCSGLSMLAVRTLAPPVYGAVMSYSSGAVYRAGVRLDFAVFSLFWYLLPFLAARLVREPFDERIKRSAAVYMTMVLPFLAVGWGNYSNRYLLMPWIAASFIVAAMACHSRLSALRHPLLIRLALIPASGVFCYYVLHLVVI